MKVVSGIILKDKKGRVLAIHASKHPVTRWGIPKGRVDKGETPRDAAIREFYEECGINLKKFRKSLKKEGKVSCKNKELHVYSVTVKKSVKGKVDGKEIDGIAWISPKQFRKFGEKGQKTFIKK